MPSRSPRIWIASEYTPLLTVLPLIVLRGIEMKVELIAHTPNPDYVCATASQTCVWPDIPKGGNVMLKSLKHALASGHESVAEHASFTFAVEGVSRVTEIQLVRHRIGASYAIQSGRYCTRDPTNYVIPFDTENFNMDYIHDFDRALRHLDEYMEEMGMSAEDRRYFYPQGLKTNIVVTMNGRELLHFFRLRCCHRAQWEIRELADKMLDLVKDVAPIIFEKAGPSCVATGRCPEGKRSCGRVKE